MAPLPGNMTRSSSSDSSALSNILVAGTREEDSASEGVSASTPPTSMHDNGSTSSAKAATSTMDAIEEESGRRPKRARSNISTYNLKKLSEAQIPETAGSSRHVSGLTGRTLVDGEEEATSFGTKVDKALGLISTSSTPSPQRKSPRNLQRQPSVKDRAFKAMGKARSILGKRGRDFMEAGKRKLGKKEEEQMSPQQSKVLKELNMGKKGVLDELDLSDDEYDLPPERPLKRARTAKAEMQDTKQVIPTAPPLKIMSGKKQKKWQKEGLYVGQEPDFDHTQHGGGKKKLQKKRPGTSSSDADASETTDAAPPKRSFMTLPMFGYLDKTRDFVIPFDVYAPSYKKGDEKPKDWKQLNRNRLIGEAKELWEEAEKLPNSRCVCKAPANGEDGCGEYCHNRVMQYECNEENCALPAAHCSNRAFAELAARMKKGGAFDVGVEVIKTANRGFGVRSCRTFTPGQIIMEYTGEIISEGECQRRMREEYIDKQCYYLMELERGLIIDGTKGSMARFINHSCAPNCEVRMVKVNGTPRMAVFAGDDGVMTGEELTYDYNFDNFGTTQQICYCGAATCRGFLSKRLNAAELKKKAREDEERRRVAAIAAQKQAAAEAKKQETKNSRGSSWRGWVAVDDPDTKEQLKREKKEREEAEKNSTRAQRLALRRETLSAPEGRKRKEPVVEKAEPKRRKTTHLEKEVVRKESTEIFEEIAVEPASTSKVKDLPRATSSSGSKFTEELSPEKPTETTTTSTIFKQTETITEIHQETRMVNEELTIDDADVENDDTADKQSVEDMRPLSRGKERLKGFGQALKNGLMGINKAATGSNGGKWRQSTLSFAKIN